MNETNLPSNVYALQQSEFRAIPESPWVYWISKSIRRLFEDLPPLSNFATSVIGCFTCDNFRFVRYWWEIGLRKIKVLCTKQELIDGIAPGWVRYMKGGKARWHGNHEFVVKFYKNGEEIRQRRLMTGQSYSLPGEEYYLNSGLVFSHVSSNLNTKYLPDNFIFDVASSGIFSQKIDSLYLLGMLKSNLFSYLLGLVNPTINIQANDINRIPITQNDWSKLKIFVMNCIHLEYLLELSKESSLYFISPLIRQNALEIKTSTISKLKDNESNIDNEVYNLYSISQGERNNIEDDLASKGKIDVDAITLEEAETEEEIASASTMQELAFSWLSYTAAVVLGRFQTGISGALGSAIYRRADFAIGSLPEPTEEEFNELVGDLSQFAYIEEQGGRHVFSSQVEQALQALAVPDGITVFDPNHPRDLPTLVSKALELMLSQAQAQEVIQQAAGGDLRKFLEKDFFTQNHIKQYHKRPVYWPIQSIKRSYGFVLFHEKIDRNTFYALQQEPYLPTKRRAVQLRLEELNKKVLSAQGANRKPIEREMDELRQLAEELAQFARDLEAITRGGYEPESNWIDDGVILRMAPLWSVIPLWKSEPKKYWDELAAGKYDWSRIAMKYWPERVKKACKKNKSYAIAHGHEEWYSGG